MMRIEMIEKLRLETLETLIVKGRKKELKQDCIALNLHKSGTANDLAKRLLQWYNQQTYEERLAALNLILEIDSKPPAFHGKTVRKAIGSMWRTKIRPEVLRIHNYTCSICQWQSIEESHLLEVHEVEKYNENGVCDLIDLELLCKKCHAFNHWNRTRLYVKGDQLIDLKKHWAKVNKLTLNQFEEYVTLKGIANLYEQRDYMKKIQSEILTGFSTQEADVRFLISGDIPYKEEIIAKLQSENLYFEI